MTFFTDEITDALASIDRHMAEIRKRAEWLAERGVQTSIDVASPRHRYGDTQKVPLAEVGFKAEAALMFHRPTSEAQA